MSLERPSFRVKLSIESLNCPMSWAPRSSGARDSPQSVSKRSNPERAVAVHENRLRAYLNFGWDEIDPVRSRDESTHGPSSLCRPHFSMWHLCKVRDRKNRSATVIAPLPRPDESRGARQTFTVLRLKADPKQIITGDPKPLDITGREMAFRSIFFPLVARNFKDSRIPDQRLPSLSSHILPTGVVVDSLRSKIAATRPSRILATPVSKRIQRFPARSAYNWFDAWAVEDRLPVVPIGAIERRRSAASHLRRPPKRIRRLFVQLS